MQHAAITPQGNPDYEAADARARSVDAFLDCAPMHWIEARAKEVLTDDGLATYLAEAWVDRKPESFTAFVMKLLTDRATEQAYGEAAP